MSQTRPLDAQTYIAQTFVLIVSVWLVLHHWPLITNGGQVHWLPATALLIGTLAGLSVSAHSLFLLARWLDWIAAHQPKPSPNAARWATWSDFRKVVASTKQIKKDGVPFWGVLKDKPSKALFIWFQSNAYCVAPAGSGKGIFCTVPALCALAGRTSKISVDFKGEQAAMMIRKLKAMGEQVIILNPSGKFTDSVGDSDCLNTLDVISDNLLNPGQIHSVLDDLRELSGILIPEKENGKTDPYWPLGARGILELATLIECMVEGRSATLSGVAGLIEDRRQLEMNLRWIIGVDKDNQPETAMPIEDCDWAQRHDEADMRDFATLVRARAGNLLILMSGKDRKTFDTFITQAQQALAPFAFGSLAKVMGKSSFDLNDFKRKDRISTLFIMLDESRLETSKRYLEMVTWQALLMLKRHPNKQVPVTVILDEVTNYYIKGLDSLLTWGRGFGIKLLLVFQALAAFEKTYGKQALETLHSETEIKLFLPGQRSPQTLEFIAAQLGKTQIMKTGLSQGKLEQGLSEQFSQDERALKSINAIREGTSGLLFVRDCPPAEIIPRSYAEIAPWRDWVGINPFHGKPFKKRIRLRVPTFTPKTANKRINP